MTMNMNWDSITGKWKQFVGEVKRKWGKSTDDKPLEVSGNREVMAGKIQEKYGVAKEETNKKIDKLADDLKV